MSPANGSARGRHALSRRPARPLKIFARHEPRLDLEHLAAWAARKGIGVVATGDFTHPAWRAEFKEKLQPAEPGLFRLRPEIERAVAEGLPPACRAPVRFMLEVEISTIYKKGEKTRKVHHLIYAPDFATADCISERLARIGNIASDGRPILGLDSRDLLEITLTSSPDAYLVPAHIWTPWFAALGSQSGFDSISACYGDLADHIFAVETGLSSDPPMNWRLSMLDRYRLVSNSDAHSPGKLGREATTFDCAIDYFAIRKALETREGFVGTVEFFPEGGKYHLDGHRKCGVKFSPRETLAQGGRCPVCGGAMTVGVLSRVETLPTAARPRRCRRRRPALCRTSSHCRKCSARSLQADLGARRSSAAMAGCCRPSAPSSTSCRTFRSKIFRGRIRRCSPKPWRGCAPAR